MSVFTQDLLKRTVITVLSFLIVGLLIFYSSNPFFQIFTTVVVSGLASLAVWEFIRLCDKKALVQTIFSLTSAFFLVSTFYLANRFTILSKLPQIAFFIIVISAFLSHFRTIKNAIIDIATTCFAQLYISIPLGMILSVLTTESVDGRLWIVYLIVVTKACDIAAYFGGKLFGGSKLIPWISPNKTVIGGIFGFVFTVMLSISFAFISPILSYMEGLVLGIILGILGQLGDFLESMFKRDAKVKDSNTIPGVGGFLDMLDSIFINAPVIYFFIS